MQPTISSSIDPADLRKYPVITDLVKCPNCGSTRVGSFRLDSDWGHGGDWGPANPVCAGNNGEYTDGDMEAFDGNSHPDIECYVCCVCSTCFD